MEEELLLLLSASNNDLLCLMGSSPGMLTQFGLFVVVKRYVEMFEENSLPDH